MELNEDKTIMAETGAAAEADDTLKGKSKLKKFEGIICLAVVLGIFYYLGQIMGMANMLNTLMHTAHDLLLNTVFYLMAICVLTGAIGRILWSSGSCRLRSGRCVL